MVLGTAKSNGITPKIDDCYDPTSRENVLNQTYPSEDDMIDEMNQFKQVLYKYDIDIILNKPLQEVIIAGSIKAHQENSFFEQELLLEPLETGGIFRMTRAPLKPEIQIWSGIIAHPEGMITFTKSIDIVDEI